VVFVNDGSADETGSLAEEFAKGNRRVRVIHHPVNMNLGAALKTGFTHSKGDYIVTLDLDMSYAPTHIGLILDTLEVTAADMVVASPYMKGGKVTAVPLFRRILSRNVNRLLRVVSQEKLSTFTCMVRGYKTEFLKSLNLKATNYEISPEIIYKSQIMRARIVEVPAHLDWTEQGKLGKKRKSGMRIMRTLYSGLMSGFIYRPYSYFLFSGLFLLVFAFYIITWIFINTFRVLEDLAVQADYFDDRFSTAVGLVFEKTPHSFMVGGVVLLVAIQLLSLSFISLQKKRYFDELFHLNTSILKEIQKK
jgi:glycosyltransferase involved in cell wall biosynthesis